MKKTVLLNGKMTEYILEYKNVKNINLRIKSGNVFVSASRRVPIYEIESFMKSKADFIEKAVKSTSNSKKSPLTEYFTKSALIDAVDEICKKHYPYFKERCGVPFPKISFPWLRSMAFRISSQIKLGIMLVKRLPMLSTIRSASSKALTASFVGTASSL